MIIHDCAYVPVPVCHACFIPCKSHSRSELNVSGNALLSVSSACSVLLPLPFCSSFVSVTSCGIMLLSWSSVCEVSEMNKGHHM